MTNDITEETSAPRLIGEAAFKAQREAIDQHNATAKKQARERQAASRAVSDRERRLATQEEMQLRALNARLDRRD
jgi:hypothetical protein